MAFFNKLLLASRCMIWKSFAPNFAAINGLDSTGFNDICESTHSFGEIIVWLFKKIKFIDFCSSCRWKRSPLVSTSEGTSIPCYQSSKCASHLSLTPGLKWIHCQHKRNDGLSIRFEHIYQWRGCHLPYFKSSTSEV